MRQEPELQYKTKSANINALKKEGISVCEVIPHEKWQHNFHAQQLQESFHLFKPLNQFCACIYATVISLCA